jgi:hypothetical protein
MIVSMVGSVHPERRRATKAQQPSRRRKMLQKLVELQKKEKR